MDEFVEIAEVATETTGFNSKALLANVAAVAIGYGIGWGISKLITKHVQKKNSDASASIIETL